MIHSENEKKTTTHIIPSFTNNGEVQILSNGSELVGVDVSIRVGIVHSELPHDGLRDIELRRTTIAGNKKRQVTSGLQLAAWTLTQI